MSEDTVKSREAPPPPADYEKEDYDDYPKPTNKEKIVLVGMLSGLVLLFLFIIIAVGF